MHWNMMGEGWFNGIGFGMHGVGMLIFWGLLIWLVVALVRMMGRNTPSAKAAEESALAILSARFARGELGAEEYEQMRRTLSTR